jgi:hypothetical protein
MQIKTSKLTGAALDWAVAKCEGVRYRYMAEHIGAGVNGSWWLKKSYSTDWSQGGPIIEREFIEFGVSETEPVRYAAKIYVNDKRIIAHGSTHLIAAMRCYVASKLGDAVEIPDELVL